MKKLYYALSNDGLPPTYSPWCASLYVFTTNTLRQSVTDICNSVIVHGDFEPECGWFIHIWDVEGEFLGVFKFERKVEKKYVYCIEVSTSVYSLKEVK